MFKIECIVKAINVNNLVIVSCGTTVVTGVDHKPVL